MTELRQIGDLSPKAGSSQGYRVYDPSGLCPSLEANGGGLGVLTAVLPVVKGELDGWRIRKLTPRECYRLMGVKDSDVDKIQSVISKSQQYKTAGNSIVSSVLCALFLQLNIQGIKSWNDRTEEERRQFWDLRGR